MDGLAALVLPAVAVVSALVLLSAAGTPELRTARFYGLMLLFVAAALMTVLATTLPTLLMSWEVMGATSFALIGYHWRDPETVGSGTTAFLTTRTADLGLYVAAGAALAGGAGLGLGSLPGRLRWVARASWPPGWWWPGSGRPPSCRSRSGSRAPCTAPVRSARSCTRPPWSRWVATCCCGWRPTLAATGWADDAAAWAGAATAVLLGLVALAQSDLKQLLAASTAAQLGFVVLAAGVGATAGGATHLVAHAAVKAGLFLAAGIWLQALGTKRLSSLTGAARIWPVVGACAAASLLSLAGLPPLALWATKDAVLAAAATQSAALYVAGLLGAALSAAYATKALVVLTRRLPDDPESGWDGERDGTRTAPTTAWAPLLPLAAGAVVLGVLALPPLLARVQELVGGAAPEPGTLELVTSALLAVTVIVATVVAMRGAPSRRLTRPRVLTSWLFLEQLAHRTVVRPVEVLAHRLAHLDDAVLDRGVEATARGTARLTRLAARVDDRAIDGGVTAVVSGVRRLGGLARRPQTGQLHQYYLQALAVLAGVLVLVLVR